MSDPQNSTYVQLCQHARETALLSSVEELIGWDERTKLPSAAGPYRAEQITHLAGLIHSRRTDPKLGDLLGELAESPLAAAPHSTAGTTIRQLRRQYDKNVRLPQSLVEALTKATVLGQQSWSSARGENDFDSFRPKLEEIIRLTCEKADAIGYDECRYDALLDDYEPNERASNITRVFADFRDDLVPLVQEIAESSRKPDLSILQKHYPADLQEAFGKRAAAKIGFQFDRGRLDTTDHPFCMSGGPNDCRITTRYHEDFFPSAFFSIMHEAGHGIYEQGLPADLFGLPPGESTSLGIHESQSRMWENIVGRSRPFWQFFYADAQKTFPAALGDVALDDFHFAVNDVRPSLIRVEADEVTYSLHIFVRFELEQALINDGLPVADLPDAWNQKYEEYLGIAAPNHSDGVLQDIHWSAGLIGYFATYALGNLYAAQFYATADEQLGGLAEPFGRGQFSMLREWLRENIHQHGQCYSAAELVERVTGRPLSHRPLMNQLRTAVAPLYGIS